MFLGFLTLGGGGGRGGSYGRAYGSRDIVGIEETLAIDEAATVLTNSEVVNEVVDDEVVVGWVGDDVTGILLERVDGVAAVGGVVKAEVTADAEVERGSGAAAVLAGP